MIAFLSQRASGRSALGLTGAAALAVTGIAVLAPQAQAAEDLAIAEVQGTGASSPYDGRVVRTEGVVTADFGSGGFRGFYVQDPAGDPTDEASDGLFVYDSSAQVEVGDSVRIEGEVSEYQTLTEITADSVTELDEPLGEVAPLEAEWSALDTAAEKEAHEGELVLPHGPFTVTDNYDANFYGSFGLAAGETALPTPTDVADAQDSDAIEAIEADNAARRITLDDGASTNFNNSSNKDQPLPWLTPDNPVRVGARVNFEAPLVLDYRYGAWSLQPPEPVTDDGAESVTFTDTRPENLVPQEVGGDVSLATFNVLNYFPTTGEEIEAAGGSCTYYTDRDGEPVGVNRCTTADGEDGPRGAADAEDLARQETKIVHAINTLDAGIVSLEELENSVKFGKDRDAALDRLVAALNRDAGGEVWAAVPSPAADGLPAPDDQDVIRTAFIYRPAEVELVGESKVLVGSEAFGNARKPLAQGFKATGAPAADAFVVSANHFKSKGSGVDDGTGQGNANPDRIRQAEALVDFADEVAAALGTERVFLAGDFNAYSAEDPVQRIEAAGYTNLNVALNDGESTYNYDGMDGSLDHVFASEAALDWVTGVDVWQINAQEQVGYEYSRHNYNATLLYDESVFRSSDHNPEIVGLDLPDQRVTSLAADDTRTVRGRPVTVPVTATGGEAPATGLVTISAAGEQIASGGMQNGRALVTIPARTFRNGDHTLHIEYAGDRLHTAASTNVRLRVGPPVKR